MNTGTELIHRNDTKLSIAAAMSLFFYHQVVVRGCVNVRAHYQLYSEHNLSSIEDYTLAKIFCLCDVDVWGDFTQATHMLFCWVMCSDLYARSHERHMSHSQCLKHETLSIP